MSHTLPELPYAYDALEPYIDKRTMEIHHQKHHAAYISKLNAALEGHSDWLGKDVKDLLKSLNKLPESIQIAVRNNGGGHYNHGIFWNIMAPNAGGTPKGDLADRINQTFGGFNQFKEKFSSAAANRFGSGWAWLTLDQAGKLGVISTANQDNPVSDGLDVLMGIDVWEHAYYLKYQNKRPEYIENWWNVVNWEAVAKRFEKFLG